MDRLELAITRLQNKLDTYRESYQKELTRFQERLASDPAYAIQWGGSLVESAYLSGLADRIYETAALLWHNAETGEGTGNFDPAPTSYEEAFVRVYREAMDTERRHLIDNLDRGQSTSPLANGVAAHQREARSDFCRQLFSYSLEDAEEVLNLRAAAPDPLRDRLTQLRDGAHADFHDAERQLEHAPKGGQKREQMIRRHAGSKARLAELDRIIADLDAS